MEPDHASPPENKKRITFSFDPRLIIVALLVVIAAMLFIWKPWSDDPRATDRTVEVSGQATVTATPDEFIFYPSYEFTNTSQEAALAELTKKSDEIVTKLKALGVEDSKIKTNASDYGRGVYYPEVVGDKTTYTLQLTITTSNKDLTQKVQDYLVSTTPQGEVTPEANFSKTKREMLESQARDQATKNARAKAEQSAKNLGYKIGKVKSVSDNGGFGDIMPLRGALESSDVSVPQLKVQPGENELSYSVTVVYYIK